MPALVVVLTPSFSADRAIEVGFPRPGSPFSTAPSGPNGRSNQAQPAIRLTV